MFIYLPASSGARWRSVQDMALTLACSLALSWLDHCNVHAAWAGSIHKLQCVHNTAAWIIRHALSHCWNNTCTGYLSTSELTTNSAVLTYELRRTLTPSCEISQLSHPTSCISPSTLLVQQPARCKRIARTHFADWEGPGAVEDPLGQQSGPGPV